MPNGPLDKARKRGRLRKKVLFFREDQSGDHVLSLKKGLGHLSKGRLKLQLWIIRLTNLLC
jgi:hypothetical protein